MTLLVAIVGVGVTLTLPVTERTRETGLLRAVGLTRGGVRAMVSREAALAGVAVAVPAALGPAVRASGTPRIRALAGA
ncbi:ABC transporter permease [Pseudonocardia sp. T1-2H]|uniref:ABC transporter permease n=1 Tax=Pseudonocardia sp. T1-2H TaxID=3128899 RepID=UPI003100E1FB